MVSMRLLALLGLVSTAVSFLVPAPRLPSAAGVSVRAPLAVATPVADRQGRTTSLKASKRGSLRMAMERTYIMIKPDGVQRGLVSDIIGRFERRGYHLVALKLTQPTRAMLEEHYSALKEKPFFPKLMDYMTSGPVVAMVWEGKDVVATGRKMLGATNPLESAPGTIRGDYCIEVGRNICHGSDSVDSANREISLWFSEEELLSWTSHSQDWIYE